MGRLESYNERSHIQQFIWGLEGSLAKAVTLQYVKTIHVAIGHAEAIELARLMSKRFEEHLFHEAVHNLVVEE